MFLLDVEADRSDTLRQEVEKLLRVVLQHKAFDPSHNRDCDKPNSWVHCGRTKVFLTQLMVSHLHTPTSSHHMKSMCNLEHKYLKGNKLKYYNQHFISSYLSCLVFQLLNRRVKHTKAPVCFWSSDLPGCFPTARSAGGSEEEDPVPVCLLHSVLLAEVPASPAPRPPAVCYSDPSR